MERSGPAPLKGIVVLGGIRGRKSQAERLVTIMRREFAAARGRANFAPVPKPSPIALNQFSALGAELISVCGGEIAAKYSATGKRDEAMTIPIDGTGDMPGCFGQIVAKDSADETIVWMTETWERQASHDASLTLPAVKNSITQANRLTAGFEEVAEIAPVGGAGLARKWGL